MPRSNPLVAVIVALMLAIAACGGDEAENKPPRPDVAQPADFPKPAGRTLSELRRELEPGGQVLAPSVSVLEPGRNRFGFGLFDRARKQIAQAPAAIYLAPAGGGRAEGPFPARYESLAVKPEFQSRSVAADPDSAKSVYVAEVAFPRAGDYELLGVVRLDGRLVATESAGGPVRVVGDGPTPEVGEPAPRVSTPTRASVGGAIDQIETRVPPDSMHEVDFADVLGKKPAVLLFSTPALCVSRVCGPVVDIAEQVKARRGGDAEFIHMEIYNENETSKGFRPQVLAWKLPTEPWAFAVDRRGRVAARLEGAFSARELEQAVDAAARG